MTATVLGKVRQDDRPPIAMDAAPAPSTVAAPRPTVVPRPFVRSVFRPDPLPGHLPTDAAVRRYWTALIGPGAVADLLRLIAAAHHGRLIRQPLHLVLLAREGLVERSRDVVVVPRRVPYIDEARIQRLTPRLRVEYRRLDHCQQ